jgi:Na+/proline symporter
MLLGHYLPTGLLGLAFVAMMASIMSTVDSNMNFGAQVFIHDIYQRFIRPDASMESLLRIGKWVMLVILALALWVATAAENVIDIAVFMLGLSSAELTANWGQWWWWRFNGPARLAASFGGPLIFLFNKFVLFRFLIDAGTDSTYIVILSSIVMTAILWVVVALYTAPEPEEKLIAFYREAKPMGWWGPVARACGETPRDPSMIINGFGIAFLGFLMLAAGTIGFSHLYIGRWAVAGVAIVLAFGSGWLFRRRLRPFIRRVQEI